MDKTSIKNIAKLARIRISEDETESLAAELTNIFDWIEQLSEVNTDNVNPMNSVDDMEMPSRVDVVNDGNDAERVLRNAPELPLNGSNFYTVPKVIG